MVQTIILILFGAGLLWGVIALFRHEGKKTASLEPTEKKKRAKEWALVILLLFFVVQWANRHEAADKSPAQQTTPPVK
jgi:cbb3-type cytochrome oxidase subunit 3